MARIDDLLYVDDLTKHSDQFSSISKVSVIAHKSVSIPYSVPVSSTPFKTAFSTPTFSPAHLISPIRGDRSPFMTSKKIQQRGFGVKKILTDYLSIDTKSKDSASSDEGKDASFRKASPPLSGLESFDCMKEAVSSISSPVDDLATD